MLILYNFLFHCSVSCLTSIHLVMFVINLSEHCRETSTCSKWKSVINKQALISAVLDHFSNKSSISVLSSMVCVFCPGQNGDVPFKTTRGWGGSELGFLPPSPQYSIFTHIHKFTRGDIFTSPLQFSIQNYTKILQPKSTSFT